MEDNKGFSRAKPQTENGKSNVWLSVGLIIVSFVLAVFTAVVINI